MKGGTPIIALYIILGIIAILALLLALRVGINIILEDELKIFLKVLFIKVRLFPSKRKKFNLKKHEKKQKKKQNTPKTVLKERKQTEKKPSLLENISTITDILRILFDNFSKYLHVRLTKIHINVATGDAAQTAIFYGAVSAAVSSLITLIEEYTVLHRLKKSSVSVEPDFLGEVTEARINISLSISIFGALVIFIKALIRYFASKSNKA